MANQLFIGFGLGIIFIILSGILTGGILFADLIPISNSIFTFIILGIPYGFLAGFLYLSFVRIKKIENGGILKKSILFGLGFWLSFFSLYIVSYFALSSFIF